MKKFDGLNDKYPPEKFIDFPNILHIEINKKVTKKKKKTFT